MLAKLKENEINPTEKWKDVKEAWRKVAMPICKDVAKKINALPKVSEIPYDKQGILETVIEILQESV